MIPDYGVNTFIIYLIKKANLQDEAILQNLVITKKPQSMGRYVLIGCGYSEPDLTREKAAHILSDVYKKYRDLDLIAPNTIRSLAGVPVLMGRRKVGSVMLPNIVVPHDLKFCLSQKSTLLGVALSTLRRKAYKSFTESDSTLFNTDYLYTGSRPKIVDNNLESIRLSHITVPEELAMALKTKAKALSSSVADVRRSAYYYFCKK